MLTNARGGAVAAGLLTLLAVRGYGQAEEGKPAAAGPEVTLKGMVLNNAYA
jgi:hypothetical protein